MQLIKKKEQLLVQGATDAQIKANKEHNNLYRKSDSYSMSMITCSVTDADNGSGYSLTHGKL